MNEDMQPDGSPSGDGLDPNIDGDDVIALPLDTASTPNGKGQRVFPLQVAGVAESARPSSEELAEQEVKSKAIKYLQTVFGRIIRRTGQSPEASSEFAPIPPERAFDDWFREIYPDITLESGARATVIFLHGIGREASVFRKHIEAVEDHGIQGIAISLPYPGEPISNRGILHSRRRAAGMTLRDGAVYGTEAWTAEQGVLQRQQPNPYSTVAGSEHFEGMETTVETSAQYVAAIIGQLRDSGVIQGPVYIAGQSLGSMVAARLAANQDLRHRVELAGIICCSGPFRRQNDRVPGILRKAFDVLQKVPVSLATNVPEIIQGISFLLGGSGYVFDTGSAGELLIETPARVLGKTYDLTFTTPDWEETLSRIPSDVRALFLKGEKDGALNLSGWEACREVPHAVIAEVPNMGHQFMTIPQLLRAVASMANERARARAAA